MRVQKTVKITSRGDYGLRALMDLAQHYASGESVQVKDIARRQEMPEDYLGQLMVALRKSGLVESTRGPSGGYTLARSPGDITFGEALRILEGPLASMDCLDGEARCSRASACGIRSAWREVIQAAESVSQSITLESLCQRERGEVLMYYI